jgi:hypothetical protein
MKSWDIIGWIVLGFSGLVLGAWLLRAIAMTLAHRAMHRRTRNDPPKVGDVWIQDGSELRITKVHDNGMISVETDLFVSKASWGETPEKWRERVKKRKLWRSRP